MAINSLVMDFSEAVDFLAEIILVYEGKKPYVATVEGIAGIGKTYFCRSIWGIIGFNKQGTVTKPHDLRREIFQQNTRKRTLDFYLIENHDAGYELINREVQQFFDKEINSRILMVSGLSPLLDSSEITLEKLARVFNLIVENPYRTAN